MCIRVVIAEDEVLTREAFAKLLGLEDDIEVVAHTGRGDEVTGLIEEHRAGLALLDIRMPGADGVEVAERLHRERPGFPVVLMTSHGRPGQLPRTLRAGVRGFLTKETTADTLLTVIRTVWRGGRYIDPELAAEAVAVGANPLTAREIQVLRCSEDGRPLSGVAAELHMSAGTVRNHMSSAIRKLGTRNRATALHRAQDAGWL